MAGYWNAHSDRDWEEECGIYDTPPCVTGQFTDENGPECPECGAQIGEPCRLMQPPRPR
jgi:hypothetical protein